MTFHQLGKRNWLSKAFNLEILQQQRLRWVDYLRGIAIVLIVYRHVLIGIQRGLIEVPDVLVQANMIFYSFRMPLFFILSGLFITRSLQKWTLRRLGWIKFEALLYPYLVWSTIQITMQISLSGITNSDRSLVDYTHIFYQPRSLDQFWYLPALFNTTIIYLLLKSKLRLGTPVQLLLGLGLYFISPYFQRVSMMSDWMEFYFFFALGDAIRELFFRPQVQAFFKSGYALLLVIPVFIAVQLYYLDHIKFTSLADHTRASRFDYLKNIREQSIFMGVALTGCLSMFVLAFRLQEWKILNFLRVIGYHSLYIYVMHVIVTASVRLGLIIFFGITNPFVLLFTSIAFGLVVPVMAYNLLMRKGPLRYLFAFRKEKPAAVPAREVQPGIPAPPVTAPAAT